MKKQPLNLKDNPYKIKSVALKKFILNKKQRLKNNNTCDCSGKSLKLPHRCAGIEITTATFTYIKLFFIL